VQFPDHAARLSNPEHSEDFNTRLIPFPASIVSIIPVSCHRGNTCFFIELKNKLALLLYLTSMQISGMIRKSFKCFRKTESTKEHTDRNY